MRNLGLSWAILDILSRTCVFFGALLQASIMRWWGMRFCEPRLFKLLLCFSSWDQPPKIAWQFHSRVSQLTCIRSKWVRQPDYNFTANALWWNNVQNPNSPVRMYWTLCFKEDTFVFIVEDFKACICVILQSLEQCVFPCLADVYSMWTYLNSDPVSLSHIDYDIHLSYFLLALPLS